MTETTKRKTLKVFKVIGIIFGFIALNSATLSLLVMKMIDIGNDTISISYWDAISSKVVHKLVSDQAPNLWLPEYHYYTKVLVFVFAILGFVLSILWIFWLIKRGETLRNLKIKDNYEKQKENNLVLKKEIESELQVIEEKINNEVATNSDFDRYKKLAKKLQKLS